MASSALITGITGQDGSYLAEFLLGKGYQVHGLVRRASTDNLQRIRHLLEHERLTLHYGDLTDGGGLTRLVAALKPAEVYNLAAQSHVKISFDTPDYTTDVTAVGAVRLLEAIRSAGIETRYYQASSSEMFGQVRETPQTEATPFHPRSPYACAKLFAHWITINFREAYGLHGCSGILFNHESPRRGESFVTRKVSLAVARIKLGLQEKLALGNLEAKRDWGYAKEYVEAMWLMLQRDEPGDYVIATGETHTVRELTEVAFDHVGLDWEKYTEVDSAYYRPAEVDLLLGNPEKARRDLGWEAKTKFADLVRLMVDEDLKALQG
ncbi:MAG: GDP-mannose 4,6-dehydratase [Verrucomicrobiales bacterium]|nr:GDP-mannose 4,6-dehydratase [Verrucomicrobiales bacterium]MBL69061.1 GDP-mannose 4,6-dehydratase [Verrucomicrobiales bacterium]